MSGHEIAETRKIVLEALTKARRSPVGACSYDELIALVRPTLPVSYRNFGRFLAGMCEKGLIEKFVRRPFTLYRLAGGGEEVAP